MTGCSFLLTPTSGEKLIINAIAILASILYLLYFAMTLPFTQNDVPIIGKIYYGVLFTPAINQKISDKNVTT